MEHEPFEFKKVDPNDKEAMEQVYRLRFDVYCKECNFLNEKDYPDGIETDKYDPQSLHFTAANSYGEIIGTLRLILTGEFPLPIQDHCPDIKLAPGVISAEISRLVISRRLRRRAHDKLHYEPQVEDTKVIEGSNEFFRRARPMAFGLYREMYRESKRRGIGHWYSLMEKPLWLLLSIHGFKFNCIGEEVDFYGPVRPYLGNVQEIEDEVQKKFPKFFTYFVEEKA